MTATQPYLPVARRAMDLEDYISIARRHSGWILGPLYAGLVISVVIAYSLQNQYEATAMMQIRPSQISENLVQTTINQHLEEQIQLMQSQVTSRQSLSQIISDPHLNLYPEERAKMPLEDVEDEMRNHIKIDINPTSMSKRGVSVFAISFTYSKRREAHDTVQTLVTAFINQSTVTARTQQNTLKDFFSDELNQAKADLDKKNELLTQFRKDNEGRLPEQEGMNIQAMSSLQQQVAGLDQELARLANEKVNIETRITSLRAQMGLTDMLADQTGPSPSSPTFRQNEEIEQLNRQIEAGELQLQQLRQTFKDTYPDIRNLRANLSVLTKRRDALMAQQEKRFAAETAAANAANAQTQQKKPTNVRMLAQQQGIQSEIDKENSYLLNNQHDQEFARRRLDGLNKDIDQYRGRLAATTVLEAQYADLKRDAQAATDKYEKLQHQQDLTRENAELVSRNATEYLELLDPPSVPQKPTSPKRPLIVGAGAAISLVIGLALAGVQEAKDTSLKNLKDVRAYTNMPVLCSIPLLENTLLVKRKRRIAYLAWSAAIIVGMLAVGASMFYYFSVIAQS
ncbi:MAG: hypothetical protein KGN84_15825 [Acidobacteriota bacterium]|nr:hypothetical protein [Acidobacteriota bacterium]